MPISIRPYDIGCEPSPSVPSETLLQDGWKTYLLFFAVSKEANESGFLTDLRVAVLECQNCASTRFGYPNDEGLPEHPLYEYGLNSASTAVVEILDSPWVAEVADQKLKSMRRIWGRRGVPIAVPQPELCHFIIMLKEATFECVASKLAVERFCNSFEEAYAHVISRFSEN